MKDNGSLVIPTHTSTRATHICTLSQYSLYYKQKNKIKAICPEQDRKCLTLQLNNLEIGLASGEAGHHQHLVTHTRCLHCISMTSLPISGSFHPRGLPGATRTLIQITWKRSLNKNQFEVPVCLTCFLNQFLYPRRCDTFYPSPTAPQLEVRQISPMLF